MKQFTILIFLSTALFSFSLNFDLPPAKEEVVEPSVLGARVQPSHPITQTKEPTTIYVKPEENIDLSPVIYAQYPKIALLVPQKVIGKYANSIVDSMLSYLVFKDSKFQLELFNCEDESEKNILKQLSLMHHKGYEIAIAAMTQKGAAILAKYEQGMQIYIPTINKKEIDLQSDNIYFGGIDYEEQIDRLLTYASDKVAIFGDTSALSRKLEKYVENASFSEIGYRKTIKNPKANLTPFIKDNKKLKNASIFLNMPMVKASILASQLNVNDAEAKNILLTQICYNPLLFTLTQKKDRELMIIANAINHSDFKLKDINLLFGHNLDFSWVNYSTSIGLDYLVKHFIDGSDETAFAEKMINNQIKYHNDLLQAKTSKFESIKSDF